MALRPLHTRCIMQELAATRLRDHPTVPPSASLADADAGELWPQVFCAFEGCMWERRFGSEDMLHEHLQEEHLPDLERLCSLMPRKDTQGVAISSIYNQAIAVKCRNQAPLAGPSLDRTALQSFAEALKHDNVEALVCWSCGGVHPFVEEVADKGDIKWYQPLGTNDFTGELVFLGQPLKVVEGLLGLRQYLSRYNIVEPGQVALTDNETFEDWRAKLPELEDGILLCCPEARPVRNSFAFVSIYIFASACTYTTHF